jgi:hypothetical protein
VNRVGTDRCGVRRPERRGCVTDCPVLQLVCGRGETEHWSKALTRAWCAARLSCHRFLANHVRLIVPAAAYTVLETPRLRLLKIGGYVRSLAPHGHLRLASSHPGAPLWHLLATRERRL